MNDERARELLAQERERIEQALANLGLDNPSGEPAQDESEDDGSEDLYQAEFDAGLAQDLADQLAALERAEARLAAGTYGLSVESGEPIPDDRLEAVPTAERTLDEQRNRDRG
jgi:DnaK suppressor protein